MLVHLVISTLAVLLGQALAQDACAVGCANGVFTNTEQLGCALGDQLCVCGQSDNYQNGIRDCITNACPGELDVQLPLAQTYATKRCADASAAATAPAATEPAATEPAATEPAATEPAATEPAATEEPTTAETSPAASTPTTAAAVAETTAETAATPASASATEEATSQAATTEDADSTAATGLSEATAGSSASSTSGTAAPTVQASEDDESSSKSGLSVAAQAGIGAGVGVAAIMAIIAAICICMRRKQKKKDAHRAHSLKISQPLEGSGRQYAQDNEKEGATLSKNFTAGHQPVLVPFSPTSQYSPSRASFSDELDTNARRYEDMTPHTVPRTMI